VCRHLAYLGRERSLEAIVRDGTSSLYQQSYQPRRQRHGVVNADGWGVGWYPTPDVHAPARHRSSQPIWADPFLVDVGPHVRAGFVVAAVRSATPPAPIEVTGAAPFTDGRLLFSHNGAIDDFAERVGPVLRRTLAPEVEGAIVGATDSELVFACIRQAMRLGADLADATAQTVHAVLALAPARLNLLVAEPGRLVATAMGDTLFTRSTGDAIWVASEPTDDDPAWCPVGDGSLVQVVDDAVTVDPL
jgi:gamma-glutamyl hercynylcysteine S-oxide hydrolase